MQRRQVIVALAASIVGGCDTEGASPETIDMPNLAPAKIRLIPDRWHIENVGRLPDGRLFWADGQLDSAGDGVTKDFVCAFIFNADGQLVEHSIELIGVRGAYPNGSVGRAMARRLEALGARTVADIWVRPFRVESNGTVFGLIPRQTEDGEWRVEFMPGNTLSFYPPWEAGEYDT